MQLHAALQNEARLIRMARIINDSKPEYVCSKVRERAAALKQPVIACLGLSYKKDVDDLRESPAVEIVRRLAQDNVGELLIVEPHIAKLRECGHPPAPGVNERHKLLAG